MKNKKESKATVTFGLHDRMMKEYMKNPEFKEAHETEWMLHEFAEQLSFERKKKHMTQKGLAKKTGMKQQEVSRIERGDQNAKVGTLMRLAGGVGKKLIVKLG
jgi:ribosome-binding protein aMBF1 (putative translation factor)